MWKTLRSLGLATALTVATAQSGLESVIEATVGRDVEPLSTYLTSDRTGTYFVTVVGDPHGVQVEAYAQPVEQVPESDRIVPFPQFRAPALIDHQGEWITIDRDAAIGMALFAQLYELGARIEVDGEQKLMMSFYVDGLPNVAKYIQADGSSALVVHFNDVAIHWPR